ncbi:MAG TPA: hypothetical protein VHN38_11890, partial [Immundisolibacter sp.]|nr:hypothetical protein [Immundisolibacter sp.]
MSAFKRRLAADTALGGRLGIQAGTANLLSAHTAQAKTPLVDRRQCGLDRADTMHMPVEGDDLKVLEQIRHRLVAAVMDLA